MPISEPTEDRRTFDWLAKARSRVWSKQPQGLEQVPPAALLAGTFFYTGLSPIGSGTVGSFAAALVYYFWHGLENPFALGLACVVVLIVGVWAGGVIERTLKIQDPGIVVIDEVLGQWIALFTIHYAGNLTYIILAFLFFRIFDVIKVPPARYFERRQGGVGIMLDDVVAGLYALLAAHLVMLLF